MGWAVVFVNALAAMVGSFTAWRRTNPWLAMQLISLGHAAVVLTGILGLILLTQVPEPRDPLHARVYGPVMVIAIIYGYSSRTDDARRTLIVFSLIAAMIAGMGLRAVQTGV